MAGDAKTSTAVVYLNFSRGCKSSVGPDKSNKSGA
jgi:hypothetical protein